MARYAAGARSWWARPGYSRATIPDDWDVLLPEQTPGTMLASHLPMRRLAAALLVDAVKCLAYPREHRYYRDALRYLLGPPRDEVLPCEIACQLAGITHDHLCRALRAAGHDWDAEEAPKRFRFGHRMSA